MYTDLEKKHNRDTCLHISSPMIDVITIHDLLTQTENKDEPINALTPGRSPVEEDCISTAEQEKQEPTPYEDPTPYCLTHNDPQEYISTDDRHTPRCIKNSRPADPAPDNKLMI